MNLPEYNQLLKDLQSLSRPQLEAVRSRCAYILQHKAVGGSIESEDWLLVGILSELRRRGLDSRDTFQIRKPASYAGFLTQSENVRGLLLKAAGDDLSAVECRALGEVAAYELARFITWTDLNREAMLQYVSRVPEAIDRAYPGYMAAGLLKLVIGKSAV